MFKKYTLNWYHQGPPVHGAPKRTHFYVHKKKMRGGRFYHRAICIGDIPRIDDSKADHDQYLRNSEKLSKAERCRASFVPGGALCFERWTGRHVLCKLWEQIAKLSFVDMNQIHMGNPFSSDREPMHEDITEPEDVFD